MQTGFRIVMKMGVKSPGMITRKEVEKAQVPERPRKVRKCPGDTETVSSLPRFSSR